ncbi:MAG: hypothetical protein KGI06_04755 [Candidatus Micrarchaeota archaeon]|nr:hypothetical protein [Candidatus Micrarchaeota archaeon]
MTLKDEIKVYYTKNRPYLFFELIIVIIGSLFGAYFGGAFNHTYTTTTTTSISIITTTITSKPFVSILAYNETTAPNHYYIAIQNQGNLPSQGLAFYINPTNNLVKINAIKPFIGYPNINSTILDNSTTGYVRLDNIPIGDWGVISLILDGNSKIKINPNSDAQLCSSILYNINGTTSSYQDEMKNIIYTGNCTPDVLGKPMIINVPIGPTKNPTDCANLQFYNIFLNGSPYVNLSQKNLQGLNYYIYRNWHLISETNANIINISSVGANSITFYTTGNSIINCSGTQFTFNYTKK